MNVLKKVLVILITGALLLTETGCESHLTGMQERLHQNTHTVSKDGYSISTSSQIATEVGADILEAGGNAVDAAIAVSYVLTVVEPYASGIAGSGGMLIYDPDDGSHTFLNYMAEAALSGTTSRNIGVPGFVSGMQMAYDLYGTLDFSELLRPAIHYAEAGFEVNQTLQYRIQNAVGLFSSSTTPFVGIGVGDTLVQEELASVLRTLAENGSNDFYTGSIAQKIVSASTLTADDLAAYETIVCDAVVGSFAGYTVASAPAPFSGVSLLQTLRLMELTDIPNPENDAAGYLGQIVNIKLAVGADRIHNLCDPRFVQQTVDRSEYLRNSYLLNLLDGDVVDDQDDTESTDTTHISIVDHNGMAVSVTNTLSQFFGSKLYISGFFMNNSLRNFTNGVNAYRAGKRPRTFISPTILTNDAGDVMAIGTPGGHIITSVLASVISDIYLFGTEPQNAVNKQRIYVTGKNALLVETGLDTPFIVYPYGLGYYVAPYSLSAFWGSVNIAAYNSDDGFYATADVRRSGYGISRNK